MSDVNIKITDREGITHDVVAPTDMSMNLMEIIRSYELAEEGSLGLNWFFHTTKNGNTMYEHTGGTGGSRSSLEFFPGLQSGFIILTNNLANRKILEKDLSAFVEKISSK